MKHRIIAAATAAALAGGFIAAPITSDAATSRPGRDTQTVNYVEVVTPCDGAQHSYYFANLGNASQAEVTDVAQGAAHPGTYAHVGLIHSLSDGTTEALSYQAFGC